MQLAHYIQEGRKGMQKATKDGMTETLTVERNTRRRRSGVIMDLVKFIFDIMQTVSFMMFIEEEAIQIRGFGIMSLIRENLVEEVATQVDALEGQCNNLEEFIDGWGWAAPYIKQTYSNYVQATRDEIDAWRAWVLSKEKVKPKYGVRLVSSPSNAEIYIGDTNTHKLTPHAFYDLPYGTYKFKLTYYSRRRGQLMTKKTVYISEMEIKEYRLLLE